MTVTLLVPGVMCGSAGPLLYPREVVEAYPHRWNGVPFVLEHGGPVVGRVHNARIELGKLVADVPTLRERPEVSTGVENTLDRTPGVWFGTDYRAVVRAYLPLHVALLAEGIGAVSVVEQFTAFEFQEYERRYR